MRKYLKSLLLLLLFGFTIWTAGCTPDRKTSGEFTQASAAPTVKTTQQATTEQETTEEETTTEETAAQETTAEETTTQETTTAAIAEDGVYTSKDDVALYLHTYGKLPSNFITKKQAEALGWQGGGLDDYVYGACIGGDKFGNYEGNLPTAAGRQYYECDIDTLHAKKRGAKRIVFSNDGLIYYTGDHYNTFELLYE